MLGLLEWGDSPICSSEERSVCTQNVRTSRCIQRYTGRSGAWISLPQIVATPRAEVLDPHLGPRRAVVLKLATSLASRSRGRTTDASATAHVMAENPVGAGILQPRDRPTTCEGEQSRQSYSKLFSSWKAHWSTCKLSFLNCIVNVWPIVCVKVVV
jgi:hypothetical protein